MNPLKIGILGQYGWGNCGDEGILQAIMDALGLDHEYVILTNLPFTFIPRYSQRYPNAEIRTIEDSRTDYDVLMYGGGKVDWGFGWGCFMRAFEAHIHTMAYGAEFRPVPPRLAALCSAFVRLFSQISVRSIQSHGILEALGAHNVVATACPAFSLKEEKTDVKGNLIAVCPRFGDFDGSGKVDNEPQIDWFVQRLKKEQTTDILLIPFFPKDLEGQPRDLELCLQINKRLGGGCRIFPSDGFNARKVKYAISQSKRVIGGRYHSIVWAMAHGISYEIPHTMQGIANSKLEGLEKSCPSAALEKINLKIFKVMVK